MANGEAVIGHNVVISMADTSGGSYTAIPHVDDITPPASEWDKHTSQPTDAPNRMKRKKLGMRDIGPVVFKIEYAPANTTHAALVAAHESGAAKWFKIIYPQVDGSAGSGASYTVGPFEAYISKFTPGAVNTRGFMMADVELTYTGDSVGGIPMP